MRVHLPAGSNLKPSPREARSLVHCGTVIERESNMQLRNGIVACLAIGTLAAVAGCATGGTSEVQQTFMQKCRASAETEEERSECAWKNADRMASGN